MDENTLVKQALNAITNDNNVKSEWLASVKFLLQYLEMDDYYVHTQLITTKKGLLKRVKRNSKFIEEWLNKLAGVNMRVGETSKLRFYKLFKTSFGKEPYLDHIKDFRLRKILTKFRCSDHTLEIEVGRHKNLKVEDRVCCDNGDVESEMQFLAFCPTYTQIRNHFFGNIDPINWIDTLACKDRDTSYRLANYMDKSFKLRKNILAPL